MFLRIASILCVATSLGIASLAQSSDPNFPSPARTNVISGTINARDIGDSRLTTYYFAFGGDQGDIFVSVVTKNFDGDIDIFAADGMRPLTKLVIYSDGMTNETGRLIYLRKPENLLLRLQGRPPGDASASYQIKFGGSFVAAKGVEPGAPTVASLEQSDTRVNAVGTIVERTTPKPVPTSKPENDKPVETIATSPTKPPPVSRRPVAKPVPAEGTPDATVAVKPPKAKVAPPAKVRPVPKVTVTENTPPNPLAKIRLLVVFKDGRKIDRPMTEVAKVSVEGSSLVVVLADGRSQSYSLFSIEKFTIDTP